MEEVEGVEEGGKGEESNQDSVGKVVQVGEKVQRSEKCGGVQLGKRAEGVNELRGWEKGVKGVERVDKVKGTEGCYRGGAWCD